MFHFRPHVYQAKRTTTVAASHQADEDDRSNMSYLPVRLSTVTYPSMTSNTSNLTTTTAVRTPRAQAAIQRHERVINTSHSYSEDMDDDAPLATNRSLPDRLDDKHGQGRRRWPSDDSSAETAQVKDVERTSSGGLLFFRKRSQEEKKRISQARAEELSTLYELSDTKSHRLLRNASFQKTDSVLGTPKLGSTLTVKQAAALVAKKQQEQASRPSATKVQDPLLTDRQRQELERKKLIEMRQAALDAQLSPTAQLMRARSWGEHGNKLSALAALPLPVTPSAATDPAYHPLQAKDVNALHAYHSTAFVVHTSLDESPITTSYRARNGRVYQVPNMC